MTKGRTSPGRRINVADLMGAVVEDASGQRVGRVIDIEVRPKAQWEVVNLVLSGPSSLDRIDILRAVRSIRGLEPSRTIPWSAVERYKDRRIRLAPGKLPVEAAPLAPEGTAGERSDPAASKGPEAS
jgi:sporulation protein YlmC with PRC-barrel domain